MSRKEKVLDELKYWHGVHSKAISVFIALCGFVFCGAGEVIKMPFWLVLLSSFGLVCVAVGVIFTYKKIKRLQEILGDL